METDRRNAIVAIAASATALALPTAAVAAPADRRAWELVLARFEVAERAYSEFCANVFDPAYHAEKAFEAAHGVAHRMPDGSWSQTYFRDRDALRARVGTDYVVPEHLGAQVDALSDAFADARWDTMQTPAPDLAALRWKLDNLLELDHADEADGGSTSPWTAGYVRPTLADIARLLPEAG